MEFTEVVELARREAQPAVSILFPIEQPVAANPENGPGLRALIERALGTAELQWGAEAADRVQARIREAEPRIEPDESARSLVVLATPDDCQVLRLPFPVAEQVVVNLRFATRQLLEGLARHPRLRVLVLAGSQARLYEGRGNQLGEVLAHGFPLEVVPPQEWDTPKADRPIHEEAERERHRIVYRAADAALTAATAAQRLPVVLTGAARELAFFDEVTANTDLVIGRVTGNHWRTPASTLAELVRPVVDAHLAKVRGEAAGRLQEAYGRGLAAIDLLEVQQAAEEGRGHDLIVEEGLRSRTPAETRTLPGGSTDQRPTDDVVDEIIGSVLATGGRVDFVDPGALGEGRHLGLILRYARPAN